MPLKLVREIDESLTEIVGCETGNARREKALKKEGKELEEWSPYPVASELQLRRLILSPICLALVFRLLQLATYHNKSTSKSVLITLSALGLIWPAIPMIPFFGVSGFNLLLILLPILQFLCSMPTLIKLCIYLDAFFAPIISHLLGDTSDREQIHYIVIGIAFACVFNLTMFALSMTKSLWKTTFIGLGLVVMVQILATGIVFLYLTYVPIDLLVRFNSPPFLMALERFSLQRILFVIDKSIKRWLYTFFYLPNLSSTHRAPTTGNDSFKYRTVSTGYIRLLKILPGRSSDLIRCQFVTTHLIGAPSYEAISYVWGNSNQLHIILIDGKALSITANAYAIIHRRRSRFHERLVWIDQVCINQKSDPLEKSSQVQMMNLIYRQAALVTAWLGPSDDAYHVQSLIAQLHFLKEGLGWSGEQIKSHLLGRTEAAKWAAVSNFFRNPWFHRVWIIQEVASARKLHVIYGNICMDWTYIGRGVAVLFDGPLLDFLPTQLNDASQNYIKRRPAASGLGNADTMLALRGDIDYPESFTLSKLLSHCRCFDSTDPRDKVFSLFNLAIDNLDNAIVVNYKETPISVYTMTMRFLLQKQSNNLDELEYAGIANPREIDGLPSWVPDWSVASPTPLYARWYAAGTSRTATVRFDDNLPIIHLDGSIIDSLDSDKKQTSKFDIKFGMAGIDEILLLQEWLKEVEILAKRTTDLHCGHEPLSEAIFRTVVADQLDFSDGKLSAEQCLEGYSTLQKYFSTLLPLMQRRGSSIPEIPPEELSQDMMNLASSFPRVRFFVTTASSARRFCITAAGRMAIIPDGCKEGDVICIFNGARMPCILRRSEKFSRNGYIIVGFCYVKGVMAGELEIEDAQTFTLF